MVVRGANALILDQAERSLLVKKKALTDLRHRLEMGEKNAGVSTRAASTPTSSLDSLLLDSLLQTASPSTYLHTTDRAASGHDCLHALPQAKKQMHMERRHCNQCSAVLASAQHYENTRGPLCYPTRTATKARTR